MSIRVQLCDLIPFEVAVPSRGYVYALINPSMQGLVKVGRTQRSPKNRAAELSGATGVPTPFIVVYHEHFEDCEQAESVIHSLLEGQGYRISDSREFFDADIVDIVKAIVACPGKSEPPAIDSDGAAENGYGFSADIGFQIDSLLRRASNLEYGLDGEFQDFSEAFSLYGRAADLGSAEALAKLGEFHEKGKGVRANLDAAMDFYKRAADKRWFQAYANMASVFVQTNHERNFRAAWAKFSQLAEDVEPLVGWRFFAQHHARNWRIDGVPPVFAARRNEIRKLADDMVQDNPDALAMKLVQRLVVGTLFPEDTDGIAALGYEDIVRLMNCYPVSQNIFRHPSGIDIQILSDKWYVDRLGLSGGTPESLIEAFSRR